MNGDDKHTHFKLNTDPETPIALGAKSVVSFGSISDGSYLRPAAIQADYNSAIRFVTVQSANLSAVNNQLAHLDSVSCRPNVVTAMHDIQNSLNGFGVLKNYLPSIASLAEISPSIQFARQATIAISNMTAPKVISALADSIGLNQKPWLELSSAHVPGHQYPSVTIGTLTERARIFEDAIGVKKISTYLAQSSIVKATELSIFAERSLSTVTQQNFGIRLSLPEQPRASLSNAFHGLSNSYSSLFKSYEEDPQTYLSITPSVSRSAPIEYFSTANLVEAISAQSEIAPEAELLQNEIQYENEITLSSHLPKIDKNFYRIWKGAIEAYSSENVDKVRHFSASMRELFTHLMHKLAPDNEIREWSADPKNYHNGKPTRKSRLLYVCRNIDNGPFAEFVMKDVEATLAFIDIFQKGTHDLDPHFSPNNLIAIKSKAESTLKFLLEIYFATTNKG